MTVLETRELHYFVAVAEELHFGRAANRIGIAQPPLSRAISRLERKLGVTLLDRGARGVTLTAAGDVLYREAQSILDSVASAVHRTRRAGHETEALRLAMKPGSDSGLLPEILDAFDRESGSTAVELRLCGIGEQPSLLCEGEADVALMHRTVGAPWRATGIETVELLTERQVVLLPDGHRLAGRAAVRLDDLAGETTPCWPGTRAEPAGGPQVRSACELMQLVALGRVVAVVSESVRWHLRHDVVCVPVLDAPDSALLVAWPTAARTSMVSTFVRAAVAVAGLARAGNLMPSGTARGRRSGPSVPAAGHPARRPGAPPTTGRRGTPAGSPRRG